MKAYGESRRVDTSFLTLSLEAVEWAASEPCCFTPGERVPRNPLDKGMGGL
jgi:hypothetical protein